MGEEKEILMSVNRHLQSRNRMRYKQIKVCKKRSESEEKNSIILALEKTSKEL